MLGHRMRTTGLDSPAFPTFPSGFTGKETRFRKGRGSKTKLKKEMPGSNGHVIAQRTPVGAYVVGICGDVEVE